ncbi:dynein axonemal assembly factor 6 [Episyrphus balteatus]|uniref:dynein axonemal assembly factor 6 n=1 Tax=Episyrphus balteatus TaxID=286459 RepID=UPI0024857D00|nr:dynein axonemal assembly factor 6 [Episyrphus balteatus]
MSLFENADSILLLKKLLQNPENEDSSSDSEDENQSKRKNLGPSNFGPRPQSNALTKPDSSLKPEPKKDQSIEEWLEAQEKEDNDILETRKRPEYKITYKQSVGTEDVFLQMGNKTSASSSCEDMIIEIEMPEETVAVHQMDISVTENEIDLATPMYRLKLPLTHPINPDKSSAKYFTERKTLCLTCRMNREYDYVNF